MKLVTKIILILWFVTTGLTDEEFVFPPKFSKPNSPVFTSDSSLYLPPEAHTPLPYFPIKNSVNLPFPYLPPTRTKAPPIYPSPFPIMMSTTFIPNYENDGRENDESENKESRSTPKTLYQHNRERNRTENYPESQIAKRDIRSNYQHPIDRVDVRLPMGFSTPNPINQKPTARSMIIDQRNDLGFDQLRAGSSQASHYMPPPGGIFSSTTEPAIPILRLSNEMDLDGSFSYEALGADQTHYVQHSHMENSGTDKEEQVVEGSYSYVGDNGQTYTVHYIADSNGFRASGDHLPIAPPIPEIIQRSIQYNLAEEAKKPPHLKSWQQDSQEHDINDIKDSSQRFSIPPPPRNLFTGRTPEAFSNNFSQRSNSQNNLITAASSQHTVQAVPEFTVDQNKGNQRNAPIVPQVTFLASQGAHVPSANSGHQQMSRIFTPEKTNMPQLINYDAAFKDVEQDSNKALWRWQYGLNSQNVNQTPEKNSISRSFGEGDDIVINFNDMSPEQYSKMIHSDERSTSKENTGTPNIISNDDYIEKKINDHNDQNKYDYVSSSHSVSTENTVTLLSPIDEYKLNQPNIHNPHFKESNVNFFGIQNPDNKLQDSNSKQNIINRNSFIPPSQVVTQTYYYEDSSYEPRKVKSFITSTTTKPNWNYIDNIAINNDYNKFSSNKDWSNSNVFEVEVSSTNTSPVIGNANTLKFSDFIIQSNTTNSMPVIESSKEDLEPNITTNTHISAENILNDNIFLNKFVNYKKEEPMKKNIISDESNKQQYLKTPKSPKFINSQNKLYNEIKNIKKKPLDISEILNYITNKNHFESSKIGPKNSFPIYDKLNQRKEIHYIPMQTNKEDDEEYSEENQNSNRLRTGYHQSDHEIPGNIKNYKLLLRSNKMVHSNEGNEEIKRELMPPPIKRLQTHNLPPLGRAGPSVKSYLPPIYV